jgi:hypothetical protein
MQLEIEDSLDEYSTTVAIQDYIHDSLLADTGVFLTSFNRLKDTAAAVRVDIRDTVNVMPITDSITLFGNTKIVVPFFMAGYDRPPEDNVLLTLPVHQGDVTILFIDSAYAALAGDTVFGVATIPEDITADSLIFCYKTNGSMDSLHLRGLDISTGLNLADSVYYSEATARTATTDTRIALYINETLSAGDRLALKMYFTYTDNNDRFIMYYIQIKGVRR